MIADVDYDRKHLAALVESSQKAFAARHRRLNMWKYEQDTGCLFRPNGTFIYTGYAGGNEGKNPEGINNHAMQDVKSIGPLPCGTYAFDTPVPESKLGPFAIPLIPDPANEMFGRGHFYCHGDTPIARHASEGCIIMPRFVRNLMWESPDHKIEVVLGGV